MALITVAQFLKMYDARRVAELLSDNGVPVEESEIDTNPVMLSLMDDASEIVIMSTRVGDRYPVGVLNSEMPAVRRLTGDILFGLLVSRRGLSQEEILSLAPLYAEAQRKLVQLETGRLVFGAVPGIGNYGVKVGIVTNIPSNQPEGLAAQPRWLGCAGIADDYSSGSGGCGC